MSTTIQYRKAVSLNDFMSLSLEVRKQHGSYFHTANPAYCPVIIHLLHPNKQVILRMCKFLIKKDAAMIQQQDRLRNFIIQYTKGGITAKDSLFFIHNQKIIDKNSFVSDFLKKHYKDIYQDGWLHIQVKTMETMG